MATEFIENMPYEEIQTGQSAELVRTLTRDDIALFSTVSGDLNPTHLNESYAQETAAHGVTGHSLWSVGLISSLLGNVLPGAGTLYRRQDVQFYRPVVVGDTVTARIQVQRKAPDNVVQFACEVVNQRAEQVLSGVAEVTAPTKKVRLPKALLPDVQVRHHDSYAELAELTSGLEAIPTAVVHPCDQISLQGALDAAQDGLIVPTLVGPEQRIRQVAEKHGLDLGAYTIVDVMHSHAAAAKAVELVHSGAAELIMKGSLHTDEVLGAVVSSTTGIRTERRISHVFVMDVPPYPKLLLITDAAINIAPSLAEKSDICQNAIDLAQTLGIQEPKVAILSAVETVRDQIPSTIEAAALCKMADRGQIHGGVLDGPLAMDNAISPEAARTKGIHSPVAGQADILVAPDLEAGNILAKQLTFMANADAAGIVLGARVPIILTSRADSVRTRHASCAVAVIYANALRKGAVAGFYP
jgi:phosphate acetyltransferase